MTANTLTARTTSTDAATWVLRRADGNGWDFALTGDKATIGSGQSCTIRLIDHGVRPLHCLVTESRHGLTVRRWSDDTLLNGEVFSEAALVPGDRLTIGSVDLLLEYNASEEAGDSACAVPAVETPEPEATVAAITSQVEELLAAPPLPSPASEQRASTHRRRAKQLVELVRQERSERERMAMEIASLESRLASTETERERLVFERDELAGRLASLTSEVSQVRDEVRALSASHHQREQSLEDRLSELEQQIADRDSLVCELRDELERQQSEAREQFRIESEPSDAAIEHAASEPAPIADRATELDGEAEASATAEKFVEAATIDWWKEAPRVELPSRPSEESESTFQLLPQGDGPIDDYLPVEVKARELDHEPIAEADDAKLELDSLKPESLWDIEVQPPATSAGEPEIAAETFSPELEITSVVEPPVVESQSESPAAFDRTEPTAVEPVRSEQDLWGRLSSLRAEASERLHYEVEHPEAVTEAAHDFWAAPPEENEEVLGKSSQEPHGEEASHWLPETEAPSELATSEPVAEVEELAPAKREEPVSFIEKYKHLLDEDESTPAPAMPVHREPEPEPEPVAKHAPQAENHDDESIEAYMEKMMARLRGEPAGPTLMGDKKQLAAQAAKQPVVVEPEPVMLTPVVPVKPLEDLDEIKSGPTPEHATDMSMLRDLANNSAREAIKIAHSRRQRERAGSNLLMCIIGCVSGGFLIWASKGQMGMPLYTGAGAIAAAGYWAIRCGRSLLAPGQPKADRREIEASSEASTEAALPIR